jgi:uncharacterized membrane protein YkoI
MKQMIYAALLAALLAPPMAAQAQRQPGRGAEQTRPLPKISQEQATKIALERMPGTVTDVTIERKRGKNVYVVEIQVPEKGEIDVLVDMETGRILGTE